MNSPGSSVLLSRLMVESPLLLAGALGIVLAAIFLRRAPFICCLIGCLVLIFGTVTTAFIQSALVDAQFNNRQSSPEDYSTYFSALSIGTGLMRAVAFGLVLTAALVGRSTRPRTA